MGLQSAKEYYEQALMQELKKNQELHEYIRLVESRRHHPDRDCTAAKQVSDLSKGRYLIEDLEGQFTQKSKIFFYPHFLIFSYL